MDRSLLTDFSLGLWERPGLDFKQPHGTLLQATDVYVDDSGVLRGRGRMGRHVAVALNKNGSAVWAGYLLPGYREVVFEHDGSSGRAEVINTAATAYSIFGTTALVSSLAVAGNVLLAGQVNSAGVALTPVVYGGGLINANTGVTNIVRTAGSSIIQRLAGGFSTPADFCVGMYLLGWNVSGGGVGHPGYAVVKEITSDTQITMDRPSDFSDVGPWAFYSNPQSADIGTPTTALGFAASGLVGAFAGRALLLAGNLLLFSDGPDPDLGFPRTNSWPVRNRHEFPIEAVGNAVATLRDRVWCFTEAGVYTVSGMAYEIVDGSGNPQHPIDLITSKSVALSQKGIVSWQGALIVPCRDGIYAMDGYSPPVKLSRGLPWAEMVRGGLQVGWGAVFQNRYFLPVTYGGHTWTYVIRMDGVDTPNGTIFPASRFQVPGNPVAYAAAAADKLLAVGDKTAGVLDGTEVFTATSTGLDYDGSGAISGATIEVGPFVLPERALIRRLRVRYTSSAALTVEVRLTTLDPGEGAVSGAERGRVWAFTSLRHTTEWLALDLLTSVGTPPLQSGMVNVTIIVNGSNAAAEFTVHAVEVQYRTPGGP